MKKMVEGVLNYLTVSQPLDTFLTLRKLKFLQIPNTKFAYNQ